MRQTIGVASRRSSLSHSLCVPSLDNSIRDHLHLSGSLTHVLLYHTLQSQVTLIDLFPTSNPNLDPYLLHSDAPSNRDLP
jgi:hypothetical protein